ncbi:MAG: DUF58 domain-containing protein, partial [Lentisphaeraceae bacterium]|nr:DUF58 domain-containing protein [Lentisphaeraceae bacterium]
YKRLKKRFYRGPENMGALKIPKFVGHQTVTLTALYWLNYLVNTQLTLIGRILVLMGTLMLAYCLIDPFTLPMSYMGFGLIVIYIINFLIGYIFKPRLKVKRDISERAICGTPVPVRYKVKNTSALPCWDIKLDSIAYPGCRYSETILIPSLGAKEEESYSTSIKFNHRGIYSIPKTFAESSFPFGLWKWGKWGEGNREIRVVPKAHFISNLRIDFLAGENDQNFFQSTMGTGMEFASCREFRFGDNPRHIHWPSWARTMTPVVREMCDEGRPAVSVVFDNSFSVNLLTKYTDIHPEFEASISLLAGISQFMKNKKYRIKNLIIGEKLHEFQSNSPLDIHEKILDLSCDIEDIRQVEKMEIKDHTLDTLSATKGTIMVLQNWDESRKALVKKMHDSGLPVKVILLGSRKPDDSGPCTFIRYNDLINGRASVI